MKKIKTAIEESPVNKSKQQLENKITRLVYYKGFILKLLLLLWKFIK